MVPSPVALAWLRLALAEGLSQRAAQRLVERAGGPEAAARGHPADLQAVAGARASALAEALRAAKVDLVLSRAEALGQRVLTPEDDDWPRTALEPLVDPPCALFVEGRLPPPDLPAVAVVGTRRATPYGLRLAEEIARDLAARGFWVVSGLALGIDACAHAAALSAGRGAGGTLAVLGCGLDVRYPLENVALKDRIRAAGGLLSEHPPGAPPLRHHFPRRNRLVAALAGATVVVEAGLRSGALITARLANEMGREVLAVPGPAGREAHAGCHRLIRRGLAALAEGAADVLEALDYEVEAGASPGRAMPPPPPGPELSLWTALDPDEAADGDELCRRTGLDAADVARALTSLELRGRAVRVPGLGYRRLV